MYAYSLCSILSFADCGIGKAAPGGGKGETVTVNGKVVGYEIDWTKIY